MRLELALITVILMVTLVYGVASQAAGAPICSPPELSRGDERTPTTWAELNKLERRSFVTAKRRCGELFPGSPCLTAFIIYPGRRFHAVCGSPNLRR